MKTTHALAALMIAGTALLTACASTTSPAPTYNGTQPDASTYGTIDNIQVANGGGSSGGGAIAGGLIGALVGNQVGSGGGRTAATVAGAVGGAVVGNEVEKNRAQDKVAYQINVRLDNGNDRKVVQDSVYDLHPGDRVRVIDGRAYRY